MGLIESEMTGAPPGPGKLDAYARQLADGSADPGAILDRLRTESPASGAWADRVAAGIRNHPEFHPLPVRQRFATLLAKLRVDPLRAEGPASRHPRMDRVASGFATLSVPPESVASALKNLQHWLESPASLISIYRPQVEWLIEQERWSILLDSFHTILPFGTGGRRGPVGAGTNRFNPVTLVSSVQGHCDFLRERMPGQELSVVIAFDVRKFGDLRGIYNPDLPNPLRGISSRTFAHLAAGVYAANAIRVFILPLDSPTFVSTPELSFIIRRLKLSGGLNISASHNHPDDNGGKFFSATGGQEVPPNDQQMADKVETVEHITSLWEQSAATVSYDEIGEEVVGAARKMGLLEFLPESLHRDYIDVNLAQSLDPAARGAHIVFTPLHGVGHTTAAEVLRQAGFRVDLVEKQSIPDGSFPTVPFRAPNPEVPQAMEAGIEQARGSGADLVLACDPDADRIGACSAVGGGQYRFLIGNEIACLVTQYKLDSLKRLNRLPATPLVIKTEVTTELLRDITEAFGGRLIGDLLVGFKYHANVLRELETTGRYDGVEASLDDFIVAVEESHGVLVTPELRDKDAAGAAILLAELTSRMRAEGRNLVDYLDDIYLRYGYYANQVVSMVMSGAEGSTNIRKIQTALRERPLESIGGRRVLEMIDHQDPAGPRGPILSETDRSSRNVLTFNLEGNARVIIRPSGTEPKSKTYVELRAAPLGMDASASDLAAEKARVDRMARDIGDDFTLQTLAIIGVDLPRYALRVSGLVPLDKRSSFAGDFIPALEERVHALSHDPEPDVEAVAEWIDLHLKSYGEDARGLVGDAIAAYVAGQRAAAGALDPEAGHQRHRQLDIIARLFDVA